MIFFRTKTQRLADAEQPLLKEICRLYPVDSAKSRKIVSRLTVEFAANILFAGLPDQPELIDAAGGGEFPAQIFEPPNFILFRLLFEFGQEILIMLMVRFELLLFVNTHRACRSCTVPKAAFIKAQTFSVGSGGSGVLVDGSGVLVDGSGVLVDGSGVLVDGSGVLVDGSGVLVDESGVLVGAGDALLGGGEGDAVPGMFLAAGGVWDTAGEAGVIEIST